MNSSQIATLALKRLGAVPEGDAPSAPDMATAEQGVTLAHDELAHHGIAFWDIDDCPDGIASPFADYVAGEIASIIVGEDRALKYEARMPGAKRRMASVAATRDLSEAPVRFEDF